MTSVSDFLSRGERIKVRAKYECSARRLRRKLTDAERKLWSRLHNRQVANLKFRRQHPLGDRILDFFCSEAKLAIELDGSGHASHHGQTSDLDREIEL
jgi:very-short-patch-repair endonuclease